MHPKDNTFLTGSDDQTVLVWDLRANAATVSGGASDMIQLGDLILFFLLQGQLQQMDGTCLTAWDGTGDVFAVALPQAHAVLLYALSSFDKRPFEAGKIDDVALEAISVPRIDPLITSIAFSSDGHYILVGTAGRVHYLLDAFTLALVLRLEGHASLSDGRSRGSSGYECCFTPDSKFVMSGEHQSESLGLGFALNRSFVKAPPTVGYASGILPHHKGKRNGRRPSSRIQDERRYQHLRSGRSTS